MLKLLRFMPVVCLTGMFAVGHAGAASTTSFCVGSPLGNAASPAVSGHSMVWVLLHGTRADIYASTLPAMMTTRVTTTGTVVPDAGGPSLSNGRVVWVDCRSCVRVAGLPGFRNTKIYVKKVRGGIAYPVAPNGRDQYSPAVSGDLVVWIDHRSGGTGIWARNLSAGREFPVAVGRGGKVAPAISGHIVVWQDDRSGQWDIYGKNVSTGREFLIARHRGPKNYLENPIISGSLVVWTSWHPGGGVTLEGKNLFTGHTFRVATIPKGLYNPQLGPGVALSGHLVLWEETVPFQSYAYATSRIVAREIPGGKTFTVAEASGNVDAVAVSGRKAVWVSSRKHRSNRQTVVCSTTLSIPS